MKIAGRVWLIRLTQLGRRTLEDVVSLSEQGTFEVHVIDEDERGVWVNPIEYHDVAGKRPGLSTLVKREYVATIQGIE